MAEEHNSPTAIWWYLLFPALIVTFLSLVGATIKARLAARRERIREARTGRVFYLERNEP